VASREAGGRDADFHAYVQRALPAHGLVQLLSDDPDGVQIEVNVAQPQLGG
jgi:hypothetical protein